MGSLIALVVSVAGVVLGAQPLAEVATSSSADAARSERDEPLSDEEIALIEALAATTASVAEVVAPRLDVGVETSPLVPPAVRLPTARIRSSGARTVAEAFEANATVVDSARRYVPGDSGRVRGQTGHRLALSLEGVPLHHALTSARETPGWSTLDPWLLEEVTLERPGSIERDPRGLGGEFRLSALAPRTRPGFEADVAAGARSADRSTDAHATASLANEVAAARISVGYGAFHALRIATSSKSLDRPGDHRRAAISARARLLGRSNDLVSLHAGFDLDRLDDVPRPDLAPAMADDSNQRLLAFARAGLHAAPLDAELLVARQSFRRRFGSADDRTTEESVSYFARASVDYQALEVLRLRAAATAERSDARAEIGALGWTERLQLSTSAELGVERLSALATVALVDEDTEAGATTVHARAILGQVSARLTIAGPFGFRAGVNQALYVPSVRDLREARETLGAERAISFEAGPSIFGALGGVDLLVFHSIIDDALEPEALDSNVLVRVDDVRIAGLEVSGALYPHRDVRLAAALTWSEGTAGSAPVVMVPVVTSRASVRWTAPLRGAFLDAHARVTSNPVRIFSANGPARASLGGLEPSGFFVLGVSGGLELGLGLSLSLAVENVLDTPGRAPESLVPNAGVDVRAALAWSI